METHPWTEANHPWIEASRLWLVLDRAAAAPRSLPEVTELCIAGGVDVVVFRMKDASAEEALPIARGVCAVCREHGTPFVVAHFDGIAEELRADGLHWGRGDSNYKGMPLPEWSRLYFHKCETGWSAHSAGEAQSALSDLSYAFLGPVFHTPSKVALGEPLGLAVVHQASKFKLRVVFIGGMDASTIPQVVAAGGKRVAAIRALQSVPDPRAAAAELRALLPD